MGVHGVGLRRRQVQLFHLLSHMIRYELNSRLHFRHHALCLLDTLHAPLAEVFLLGNGANGVDVLLDITGYERAAATHASFQVDKVVRATDGAKALGDRLALATEALVLVTRCFHDLLDLRQTRCPLWGTPRSTPSQGAHCHAGCALAHA